MYKWLTGEAQSGLIGGWRRFFHQSGISIWTIWTGSGNTGGTSLVAEDASRLLLCPPGTLGWHTSDYSIHPQLKRLALRPDRSFYKFFTSIDSLKVDLLGPHPTPIPSFHYLIGGSSPVMSWRQDRSHWQEAPSLLPWHFSISWRSGNAALHSASSSHLQRSLSGICLNLVTLHRPAASRNRAAHRHDAARPSKVRAPTCSAETKARECYKYRP